MSDNEAGGRVAVLAVHGVGDQQPGETLRRLWRLVAGPEAGAGVVEELLVPVEPLEQLCRPGSADALPEEGLRFTWKVTSDYRLSGPHAIYASERLRGEVPAQPGGGAGATLPIDVYELYWADLSRLRAGAARFFVELYQLLLHLPRLGAKAMIHRASTASGWWWPLLIRLFNAGAFMLVGPITWLNLVLLAFALLFGTLYLPPAVQFWLAVLSIGAFAAAAVGLVGYRVQMAGWLGDRTLIGHFLAVVLAGTLAGSVVYRWVTVGQAFEILAASVALLVCGGAFAMLRRPEPFVAKAGLLFGLFAFLASSATVFPALSRARAVAAMNDAAAVGVLREAVLQVLLPASGFWLLALDLSWAVLGLLLVAAGLVWLGVLLRDAATMAERRAVGTAFIALTFSASLFAVITLSLWAGLAAFSESQLRLIQFRPAAINEQLFGRLLAATKLLVQGLADPTTPIPAWTFVQVLLHDAFRFYATMLLGLGILIVAALVALVPSVRLEVSPWRGRPREQGLYSRRLGAWLSGGLRLLTVLSFVAVVCFVAVPFGLVIAGQLGIQTFWVGEIGLVAAVGGVVAGATASMAVLGSRLTRFAGSLRVVLDVALDVDNYLREHPTDATVRGAIFSRYASLLRCIAAVHRRTPYRRLVIVAHSQGTMITADLLRYLQQRSPELLQGLAVHLLTVGCPLRQLYAMRFPFLYTWVDGGPGLDPAAFGMVRWVNAYTSGDYVGRTVALQPDEAAWEPGAVRSPLPAYQEVCLGPGAHTHYFDLDQAQVVELLRRLVAGRAMPEHLGGEPAPVAAPAGDAGGHAAGPAQGRRPD